MSNVKKVLVFKIDNEEFAADIMQVERILGYTEPTKVPEAPYFVKGVIKYQGGIIPIIDVKKRLNLSETTLKNEPKIVVVKYNDRSMGLIVDMVTEVKDITDEIIEEAPEIVKGISNKYIMGIVKLDERIIIMIDTEKILSIDEIKEIESLS